VWFRADKRNVAAKTGGTHGLDRASASLPGTYDDK